MRRALPLAVLALALTACGSSGKDAATTTATAPKPPLPSFAAAAARTLAGKTARLEQTTTIVVAGSEIKAHDRGTAAFDGKRAHLYKLSVGTNTPGEVIVVGDVTYSNENVQAALSSPDVKPWTKLDARALTARERSSRPNELSHVLAPAYLAYGARAVSRAQRVADGALYWARIDPALVLRRAPAARRALISNALRGDYPAKQFNARFWIDGRDRIRRVVVSYTSAQGTPIAIDTSYSGFGARVETALPPARSIKDITPRR